MTTGWIVAVVVGGFGLVLWGWERARNRRLDAADRDTDHTDWLGTDVAAVSGSNNRGPTLRTAVIVTVFAVAAAVAATWLIVANMDPLK